MNIIISNDHAGTELKKNLVEHLEKEGHNIKNVGTDSEESCDYPDFIHPLAKNIKDYDFGIIICGSANGVSMTANKHNGVRAAICWEEEIASLARQHNNANILVLGSRLISAAEAIKCLIVFLDTNYEGGRHQARLDKFNLVG